MPATKKRCEFCGRKYWACRSDAMYCGEKCRYRARDEENRLKMSVSEIPRSGIPGVTFSRYRMRWEAR